MFETNSESSIKSMGKGLIVYIPMKPKPALK